MQVHEGALEALVTELQAQHPLHVRLSGADAVQGQAQGPVHHGLAPLSGKVASHLLLRHKQVVRAGVPGSPLGAYPAPPLTFSISASDTSMTMTDTFCSCTMSQKSAAVPGRGAWVATRGGQ